LLSAFDEHVKAIDAVLWDAKGKEMLSVCKAWERYKGDKVYEKSGAIFSLSVEEKKLMQYIAQNTEKGNRDLAVKNINHLLSSVKIT